MRIRMQRFTVVRCAIWAAGLCLALGGGRLGAENGAGQASGFAISSPAFTDGGTLPQEFTGDGESAAPPLAWANAPAGTQSFAVTMHHIPGPGDRKVYWVLYNIPAEVHSLAKNARDVGTLGINTVNGRQEYAPPHSKGPGPKKYTLTVYALSAAPTLAVPAGAVSMEILLSAIKDTTLASAALTVTYDRTGKITGAAGERTAAEQGGGGPPEPQGPGDPPKPPGAEAPRRRAGGGPPELQVLGALTLTAEQKTKVAALLEAFHTKQEAARSELLQGLKGVLDEKQYQQIEALLLRPPGPPPAPAP